MFIGREEELELLEHYLGQSKSHALLLYGKRRVGKSTLILKAVENSLCKVIYFECLQSSLDNNLLLFENKLKFVFNNKYLHFENFIEIFEYLGTLNEKIVVVLDEYSYLKEVGGASYVDSMFQSIIDQLQDNVDLVLLGSYVSVMKELLERDNPLFGRFALVMKVKPFDYYEVADFYEELANKEKLQLYSVFGGLPFTNAMVDTSLSLKENILKLILDPNSAVRMYVENILLRELSKLAPANMILANLANGKKKYSELERLAGVKATGALDKQLKNLIDMEVVKKVYPINKAGDKKKTFYEIDDNLVRFYYSYIYGNTDIIARIGAEAYYELYIAKSLKTFLNHRLEEVVREYFCRCCKYGKLKGVYDVGTFWYDEPKSKTNGEFDCALQVEDGYKIYEVKNYTRPMTRAEMQFEVQQIKALASFINIVGVGFVAANGFEEACQEYEQLVVEDLYTFSCNK